MVELTSQYRVLAWSLAWALAWTGFVFPDLSLGNSPDAAWVVVLCGLAAWCLAGAATFHRKRHTADLVVWGMAYFLAIGLGSTWGGAFERSGSSAGFAGILLGWAAGGASGVISSGYIEPERRSLSTPVVIAGVWAVSFRRVLDWLTSASPERRGQGGSLKSLIRPLGHVRPHGDKMNFAYRLQPFLVSSKPSKRRLAFAPARVSRRCGCPFSTV